MQTASGQLVRNRQVDITHPVLPIADIVLPGAAVADCIGAAGAQQ
jgi:hypothetical protein